MEDIDKALSIFAEKRGITVTRHDATPFFSQWVLQLESGEKIQRVAVWCFCMNDRLCISLCPSAFRKKGDQFHLAGDSKGEDLYIPEGVPDHPDCDWVVRMVSRTWQQAGQFLLGDPSLKAVERPSLQF